MYIYQIAWLLLCILSSIWLLSHYSPVVYAVSSWTHTTIPIVATLLSVAILLQAGLRPAQLLFHAAQERTARHPHATNGNLGRE